MKSSERREQTDRPGKHRAEVPEPRAWKGLDERQRASKERLVAFIVEALLPFLAVCGVVYIIAHFVIKYW